MAASTRNAGCAYTLLFLLLISGRLCTALAKAGCDAVGRLGFPGSPPSLVSSLSIDSIVLLHEIRIAEIRDDA